MSNNFYTTVERNGNKLLHRGFDSNNKRFKEECQFEPSLYVKSQKDNLKYSTIHDEKLEKQTFSSIRDMNDFIKRYSEVDNFRYYGIENPISQYLVQQYPDIVLPNFDVIRTGYWDIECRSQNGFPNIKEADQPITLLTISFRGIYFVFGYGEYKSSRKDVKYIRYADEKEMLIGFIEFFIKLDLDVLAGYNIEGFDIPYTINRIKRVLSDGWAKKLSPWGIIREREIPTLRDEVVETYEILGLIIADQMVLYKKFSGKSLESYSLKHVSYVEIGETKMDYSNQPNLEALYLNDFHNYVEYNIRDVELLPKLENKTKLIELGLDIMYMSKTNFIDIYKNTRVWDSFIYDFLIKRNIVTDGRPKDVTKTHIAGGYVKKVEYSSHDWFVSFDFTSLYPSIMMKSNIGPDTYMGKLPDFDLEEIIRDEKSKYSDWAKEKNVAICANGTYYDRSKKSFVNELVSNLFDERRKFKSMQIEEEKNYEKIMKRLSDLDK